VRELKVSGVPPQADQGVCRRSNLILFVLVLVLVLVLEIRIFYGTKDEDDEVGTL
jgi:hypothetical protein